LKNVVIATELIWRNWSHSAFHSLCTSSLCHGCCMAFHFTSPAQPLISLT